MKATCYHMRSQTGDKVLGGSIGISDKRHIDLNAAASDLCNRHPMVVTSSGRVSFEHNGKAVWAYLSVDPGESEKGLALLKEHRKAEAEKAQIQGEKEEALEKELDTAIEKAGGMEKAIALLSAGSSRELGDQS